ncbi:MAG TPA: hypothetical protein VIK91_12510 [Nannocystis sp.]
MLSRLHTTLISSLILLAAACGDDRGSGSASATDTTTTGTPGTTTSGEPTSGEPTAGTTGSGEPTTGEPTSTTTTTDPGTTTDQPGCAAPPDQGDEDGDGVVNAKDNCRCVSNPNQLDFDGNGLGNVCDEPLVFTIADGVPPEFNQLKTQARAQQLIASCEFPVNLVVVGGDVQVMLDDDGLGKIWAARLDFANTTDLTCDIQPIITVTLAIEMLQILGPDMFTVGFPFMISDHETGTVKGMMDGVHSIVVNGIINVKNTTNPDLAMPGQTPIEDAAGSFPAGTVTVVKDAGQVTLEFNNDQHVVFEQMTESGLQIQLRGVTGTLRLRQ